MMATVPTGIQVPNVFGNPVLQAADTHAVTAAEVGTFYQTTNQWRNTVLAHLTIFNPNHGFNLVFPNALGAASDQAVQDAKVTAIRDYLVALWPVYSMSCTTFVTAIQPPVPGGGAGGAGGAGGSGGGGPPPPQPPQN
jgi:hypothetical protein